MIEDEAIASRIIPGSEWKIVFTREGRYFFWNPRGGERSWLPEESLLLHLRSAFTATKREMLFDQFCEEFEGGDLEFEGEFEEESNGAIEEPLHKETLHQERKSLIEIESEFKELLMNMKVDPFAPWPTITAQLSSNPAFEAVNSDKRRQELFAACCTDLIALKRAEKETKLGEAREWFEGQVQALRGKGVHWLDAQRRLKSDPRFGLLNGKDCERQYKSFK